MSKTYVCLDTETTGFSFSSGDKIVEIGCVKICDGKINENFFHVYVNPERSIPLEATKIHNIDDAKVKNEPTFKGVSDKFLDFIKDTVVIAHNVKFDIGFIQGELEYAGKPKLDTSKWIDSLLLSKRLFPGQKANLDSFAENLKIDNQNRDKLGHGALLDAGVLANIILKISEKYDIEKILKDNNSDIDIAEIKSKQKRPVRQIYSVSNEEMSLHEELISLLNA